MSSSHNSKDNFELQKPSEPEAKKPLIPWRAFRIVASLLTIYIGLRTASVIIEYQQIVAIYGYLGQIMGGGGANIERLLAGSIGGILYWVVALLFFVGGIFFCLKKARGRMIVWLAALLSLPIIWVSNFLIMMTPGVYGGGGIFEVNITALLMSAYLIWVLLKTDKEGQPTSAITKRGLATFAAASFVVFLGYQAWLYNYVKEPDLIAVMWSGRVSDVMPLLNEGADPNTTTQKGTTALVLSLEFQNTDELTIALLEAGADPNVTSILEQPQQAHIVGYDGPVPPDWHHKPLALAILDGHTDIAMLMIEKGANIHAEKANPMEQSLLNMAIDKGYEDQNYDLIATLINKGVPVSPNILVETTAMINNSTKLLSLLVEHGADVNASPKQGNSPFRMAVRTWDAELIRFLIDHGADPLQKIEGITALQYVEDRISDTEERGWTVHDHMLDTLRLLQEVTPD